MKDPNKNLYDIVGYEDLYSIFSTGSQWHNFMRSQSVDLGRDVFKYYEFVPEVAVRVWRV